jgi:hypothetical protein
VIGGSKKVLIRKIGNFSSSTHQRNTTIIHGFLLEKKVLNIFEERSGMYEKKISFEQEENSDSAKKFVQN